MEENLTLIEMCCCWEVTGEWFQQVFLEMFITLPFLEQLY